MIRMVAFGLILLSGGQAQAQTLLASPSDAEARAPRPARAPGLSTALAVEASQAAIAACAAGGLKVTALVVDSDGTPIAMISGDGAAAITQRIASGKARSVLKTKMSSGEAQAKAKTDAALMASLVADPAIGPPRPGAFPIMNGDMLLGALAVSGAPTGAQDEPCANAGIAAIADRIKPGGSR